MPHRPVIIVNPRSGVAEAEHAAGELVKRLPGHEPARVVHTEYAGHARDIASGIPASCPLVIVIGGDGTINEVVNGLMERGLAHSARSFGQDVPVPFPGPALPPIGLIPSGTGNTLAYELGIPKNVAKALDVIKGGRLRRLDLGEARLRAPTSASVTTRYFFCMAGAGFDAEVVRAYNAARGKKSHAHHYVRPILKAVRSFPLPKIHVTVDGRAIPRTATSVVVCNTRAYGIRMAVVPHARPDDGLLDACLFAAHTRLGMARIIFNVFLRRPHQEGDALFIVGREIRLRSDSPVSVQVDGDFAGFLPAEIHVRPGAVKFYAP